MNFFPRTLPTKNRFFCEVNLQKVKVKQLHKGNIAGNKAKGRISKRVFQEDKARQIFRKTNFSENLASLFSRNTRFEIPTFGLLPTFCELFNFSFLDFHLRKFNNSLRVVIVFDTRIVTGYSRYLMRYDKRFRKF